MKPLLLVTCTKYSKSEFKRQAAIAPYVDAHKKHGNIQDCYIAYNNKKGLPHIYNSIINEKYRDWIALCVHDDIELYNIDLASRLNKACEKFDIVGVAGNSYHNPQNSPVIWGSLPYDKAPTRSGQVAHMHAVNMADSDNIAARKVKLPFMTSFGPTWVPVKVIDGALIAFSVDACLRYMHRFDDRFDFHFYDLDFSYGATRRGMKVGTCDIYIKHDSHGRYNSEAWRRAQKIYIKKWGTPSS